MDEDRARDDQVWVVLDDGRLRMIKCHVLVETKVDRLDSPDDPESVLALQRLTYGGTDNEHWQEFGKAFWDEGYGVMWWDAEYPVMPNIGWGLWAPEPHSQIATITAIDMDLNGTIVIRCQWGDR